MLDLRIARSFSLVVGLLAALGSITSPPAHADLPPGQSFAVPKDRAEWDARRPALYDQLGGSFRALRPEIMKYVGELGTPGPVGLPPRGGR